MALEDTAKAPPAKAEPATTTAAVDVGEHPHPSPLPVPADLPSHQVRARRVPAAPRGQPCGCPRVAAPRLLGSLAFRARPQFVHHQGTAAVGVTAVGAPVVTFSGPVVVEQRVVGKKLKPEGWLAVCVLAFVFWPLMCVPCCIPACQEDVVETVYIAVSTRACQLLSC